MEGKTTYKAVQVQPDFTLKVVEIEFPQLTDDQVLVKMAAAPINPSDVGKSKGRYGVTSPPPYGVGIEGAGIIAKVGKNHEGRLKVGDRVTVLSDGNLGTWAEYTVTPGYKVYPIHPDNSFEEAASHFVNPATVFMMLKEVQKEGHKAVVQSAAASSLGKMLIRVFKENGIKTINLVRRDDVKEELLSLGADYVLNTTDADFETKLEEIAKKEQATKFYDAVCGEFTVKVLRKLPFGSVVNVYGGLSGDINVPITLMDLFGGKTISGFMLQAHYGKLSLEEKMKLAGHIQSSLKTTLKSNVAKSFSIDEIEKAIEHSLKNGSTGKTILKF